MEGNSPLTVSKKPMSTKPIVLTYVSLPFDVRQETYGLVDTSLKGPRQSAPTCAVKSKGCCAFSVQLSGYWQAVKRYAIVCLGTLIGSDHV